MDDTIHILRGRAVSDNSKDDEKSLRIGLQTTTGALQESDFQAIVDLNEEFQRERDACTKYRVIFTLNPFCTNILFNSCTEIVRNEGSPEVEVIDGERKARLTQPDKSKISGKKNNVSSYDMVRDTEYSKDELGFEYHPGRDIFNNHILRNKTYRIVNRLKQNASSDVFNTIEDIMRDGDGNPLKKCCRLEINDTTFRDKHLYDYDDILEFLNGDAVGENLKDQDGWFGFVNTSVIPSKGSDGKDMDISRALNDRGNCEFVDMYPDRTLFSVVPKYNKSRNRLEYNWDYTLTYPFENATTYETESQSGYTSTSDIGLVQEGEINGLAIIDTKYVMLPNSKNALLFRCAVKHNLKSGDKFILYVNKEEGSGIWTEISHPILVNGIGDMDNNYQDYFFYTTDSTVLEDIFIPETDNRWNYIKSYFYKQLNESAIDIDENGKRYYPGNLVKHDGITYICDIETVGFDLSKFSDFSTLTIPEYNPGLDDIPTEQDAYIKVTENGTEKIYELYNHDIHVPYHTSAYDANRFIRQIVNNAFRDNDNPIGNSAQEAENPLWTDYIQFRFAKTDGTVKSQYYVRKFKKLPNLKYGTDRTNPVVDYGFDSEYYKLAFAKTVYGDDIAQAVITDDVDIDGLTDNLGRPVGEICLSVFKTNRGYKEWYDDQGGGISDENVEFSHCFGPLTCGFDIFGLCSDSETMRKKRLAMNDVHTICNEYSDKERSIGEKFDITVDDDWYYGDVAEFCPWLCEETVLSDVCFRFNTAQRESKNTERYKFFFDEIISDDYSYNGFQIGKYQIEGGNRKKEGYFYKPHYKITLKGTGNVNQESNRAIIVTHSEPVQMDGIYIKIRTTVPHKVYGGNIVRLRNKNNISETWWLSVVSIVNDYTFIMETVHRGDGPYINWVDICAGLNDGVFALEVKNDGIPEYAYQYGSNTYLWRTQTNAWDVDNTTEGLEEFPFANGCLYVDRTFNMFVRRQDPYGCNGLYDPKPETAVLTGKTPVEVDTECNHDIVSQLPAEPYEIYKDESFAIC